MTVRKGLVHISQNTERNKFMKTPSPWKTECLLQREISQIVRFNVMNRVIIAENDFRGI